ncbi:capsule assembly Wzi family protein [Flavobacteriaceae bacterium]|nr:capsule assembly Wzi family protein [Flavobacteriaceae bacterium]
MKYNFSLLIIFTFLISNSQTINLNESYLTDYLRTSQLLGDFKSDVSFTLRPFDIGKNGIEINKEIFDIEKYAPSFLSFLKGNGKIKILPVDYNIEFNSRHPYNRNNGSMGPNRGYQHILSAGIYAEIGPLSIQLKPEYLYSQNKDFEGFGEGPNGHYTVIWAKRYKLWNHIDMPERFGEKSISKTLIGQSSIRLNFKGLSLGLSNENIWWGPSIRNSIMMSNHARGFKHITFNTTKPLKTKIGNFEWQVISGRLESSGYLPAGSDMQHAGTNIYVPKINQVLEQDDWRYLQGYTITYSPKWISGMSIGFIRWIQMYSALAAGKYSWMEGNPGWFPVFSNLFRKNDKYNDTEAQTDQGAGVFLRWVWLDSNAEIYAEYHYNDAKQNIRDLLLDTDHSRAVTVGLQKIFKINNDNFLFSWEWTQMEQTASKLLRYTGSWYEHINTYHGYTNYGEVLGSSIGPGSNSQYFALSRIRNKEKLGIALEIIDQDNDFYHEAFSNTDGSKGDFRRYWKDFNFSFNYSKKYKNLWLSSNLMYSRSLNYQWDLEDYATPYYHPGNDVNNFHMTLKLAYLIPFNN